MNEKLRALLLRHEGLRLQPYLDTVGKITIGIGRNLSDRGITRNEAFMMFEYDVNGAEGSVRAIFPNFDSFSEARQNALIDMMFNLGSTRFRRFINMIEAILAGNWQRAADEMRNSVWFTQVPTRAAELANMVQNG